MKNNLCSYVKVTHGEIIAVISNEEISLHFHELRTLSNCGAQQEIVTAHTAISV